jgi:oxygen-dependent protoporphyrinogen oxidase
VKTSWYDVALLKYMMNMENNKVIVIGAGIAGLVAAYELQKSGINVTVLESSSQSGGRMVSEIIDDCIIDTGAQFLSTGYPILSNLIKELNIESEFVATSPYSAIVKNGKIHTFRYDNPFSLLFSRLLSFKEWLFFGVNSKKIYDKTKLLPTNDYSAWHQFDDQNCFDWSSEYYGEGITNYLIEPMLEAFYFQKPEETSKALPIALNKLGYEKPKTMTTTGGISLLPVKLSEKINIIYNSQVENVSINSQSVTVETSDQKYKAEKVILATPAPIASKIFRQTTELEKILLSTSYSSTLNISVVLKKKLSDKKMSKIYGIWIPRKERKNIAAITIESNKSIDRALTGEVLNIMLTGTAGKAMYKLENENIIKTVLEELHEYIPNITKDIYFTKITRWLYAEPISSVGRSKNIYEYRSKTTSQSSVLLAGDYMGMPFTEGAAETGKWAASQIKKT